MEENKTSWPVGFLPIDLEENQRSKNSASADRIFWKKMNDFLRRMLFAKIILKSDTTRERLTRFELRCPPGFRIKKQSHQLFLKLYGIIIFALSIFLVFLFSVFSSHQTRQSKPRKKKNWRDYFCFVPPTRNEREENKNTKRTGQLVLCFCFLLPLAPASKIIFPRVEK